MKNKLHVIEAFKDRARFREKLGLNKARDNSNRSCFLNAREVYNRKSEIPDSYKKEFLEEFRELKYELRKGKYSKLFKTSYELFYLFPNIVGRIFDKHIEKKHKKRLHER